MLQSEEVEEHNDDKVVDNVESVMPESQIHSGDQNDETPDSVELSQSTDNKTPKTQLQAFMSPQTISKRRKRGTQDDPRVAEAYGLLKSISNTAKDECATYGDHIACKLRKFDDRVRAVVMHKMNNIIFNAEMGKSNYLNQHQQEYSQQQSNTYNDISPSPHFLSASECSPNSSQYTDLQTSSHPTPSPQTYQSEEESSLQSYINTFTDSI